MKFDGDFLNNASLGFCDISILCLDEYHSSPIRLRTQTQLRALLLLITLLIN